MIQICINTLNLDHITLEEQVLGHFTRKKLKKLSTWNEWKQGEVKQIEQFMNQKMFGDPIDPITLPETAIIMRPHWQYKLKRSGVRRSRMCCNGSKKAAPTLHVVASTWSSCLELPIQRMFLGISAALNMTIYGGDVLDAYTHANSGDIPTYLAVDEPYEEWWN